MDSLSACRPPIGGNGDTVAPTPGRAVRRRGVDYVLFVLPPLLIGLALANLLATGSYDLPQLVGDRRTAIFDLWSLQHFCAGILLGALLTRTALASAPWRSFLLFSVLLALFWEAAELAMEAGWFGAAISNWKDGFEHWSNRLVGDPLMVSIGSLIGRRYARAWKIVLAPVTIWLLINVTSPSSMYIQRHLF